MKEYHQFLKYLAAYFHSSDWKKLFLSGGCYWFAGTLHRIIPDSEIMMNHIQQHCALYFCHGLYDVRGRISEKDFHIAGSKELLYMKKHYKPSFDIPALEAYLSSAYPFLA